MQRSCRRDEFFRLAAGHFGLNSLQFSLQFLLLMDQALGLFRQLTRLRFEKGGNRLKLFFFPFHRFPGFLSGDRFDPTDARGHAPLGENSKNPDIPTSPHMRAPA